MALEVHSEIFIERPASEVAQTMFNPKMDKIWIRSLSEVYPMESGLYSKGAKIERIGTLLNHAYSAKVLVLKYEPEKMVELRQQLKDQTVLERVAVAWTARYLL